MNEKKYLFLVNRIVPKISGLSQAALQRATIFNEYGHDAAVVTFRYEPGYYRTLQDNLCSKGYISSDVPVINMHEYFKGEGENVASGSPLDTSGVYVDRHDSIEHHYKNGVLIRRASPIESSDAVQVEYFNESYSRYMREEHDDLGNTVLRQYFDHESGLVAVEYYLRSDGSTYLTQWYRIEDGKNKLENAALFDRDGSIKATFRTGNEMRLYFLDCLIEESDAVVVSDARAVDRWIAPYSRPNVKKVAMIHNMHIEAPFDDYSKIDSPHRALFNHYKDFDGIVTITKRQIGDLNKSGMDHPRIFSIPHSIRKEIRPSLSKVSAPYQVVIAGRLAKQKRVDHAIRVFAKTLPNVDAHLNIYGDGVFEDKLKALVDELGIGEHVTFWGHQSNIMDKVRECDVSLLTSTHEGFGLSIIESISQGVPVLAYDIKYGPSEIISEGVNGWLCQDGDINAMADKLTKVLSNRERLKEVKATCLTSLEPFYKEAFMKNWMDVVDKL